MRSLSEINSLGYLIQGIWQAAPQSWYVCFRSPFEWERWQAQGESLAVAATKAAAIARRRGSALEASRPFRKRAAGRFRTRVKLGRKRIRL